jgi:hypothetical protein
MSPKNAGPDKPPDISVHEGDSLTLLPDSKTLANAFRTIRPRTINEVREVLGPRLPTEFRARTLVSLRPPELAVGFPSLADLESKDSEERIRALRLAKTATRLYAMAIHDVMPDWKDIIDRYIQLIMPQIVVGTFGDIDVADRATLTIVPTVDAIYANSIRLHGTGKIVCQGPKTFRARSFEGPPPSPVSL